jgi:Gpi18-like mannosyltransferase
VPTVTSPGFNLTYKLPLILADYLCAVLLYRFVRKIRDEGSGRRVFILWFLNPFVIFVSSIYGNFDVLAVFLTLLALYAMYSRRYLSAGLAVGLGVSIKLYPLYLGLFCFAYLVGHVIMNLGTRDDLMDRLKSPIKFIAGAIGGASSIVISILLNPSLMVFINGRMSNNDMGGINIWGLLRTGNVLFNETSALPQDEFTLVNTVTSYLMFLILFLILLRVFIMLRSSHERHEEQMIFGSMSVFVVLLLFQPVTHAHYLLWALPFLLLCSVYQHRFEHIVFALSVVGVVFWLALQSYMAFLYPLSVYTGVVPTDMINQVVVDYYTGLKVTSAEGARIIPTIIGVGALVFALLPEKLDPAKRLMTFLRGRPHEE